MSKPYFTYGLATIKGSERKVNQDLVFALTWSNIPRFSGEEVGLFIVADGNGAPESGLKASQLAVQIVSQEIEHYLSEPTDLNINQVMTKAFQDANQRIVTDNPYGGSTLTAALLVGNQVYIAHVGDSRLYSISDNMMTLMTNDHSLMSRYIGIIEFSSSDEEPPLQRVLWRALGQTETVEVDLRGEQVTPNTRLLLCTDGLIASDSPITEADILPILVKDDPQKACDQLIELAQKAGSTDDISVIVIQINLH